MSAARAGLSGLLLAAAGVPQFGCVQTAGRLERQREWVELHPGAPPQITKAVLGKKLVQGMPEDAIIASWGDPDQKLRLGSGDARWTYVRPQFTGGVRHEIEYILVLRRGVLIAIHSQQRR